MQSEVGVDSGLGLHRLKVVGPRAKNRIWFDSVDYHREYIWEKDEFLSSIHLGIRLEE